MGTPGQLTPDKFGYSMPVDSPLYEPFPVYYTDSSLMLYLYLTDAKAAVALLPPQFELIEFGGYALAEMVFASYGFSTVGAYNEVAQVIQCMYNGVPYSYAVRLHVTNAMAMSAGREIGGFPKKLGDITFEAGEYYSSTLESPEGFRLASALLNPMAPIEGAIPKILNFGSLRVFPNPLDPKTPSLAQVIGTEWTLSDGQMWRSRGSVELPNTSTAINPYCALPVIAPISEEIEKAISAPAVAFYHGNMSISKVEIIADFNAPAGS
jgi:hypothetical protein